MTRAVSAALLPLNLFGLALAIFVAVALFFFTPPARYAWGTDTEDGGIAAVCEPMILDRPIYSLNGLSSFVTEAVLELNTYDYLTWDTRLARNTSLYFTQPAGRLYAQQFRAGQLLATVQRDYFSVSAQTIRPAIVTQTRDNGNRRSWEIEVPVRIFYQTGARTVDGPTTDKARTQMLIYTVLVTEQTPTRLQQRGIAINAIKTERVEGIERLDRLRGI